MNTKPLFTPAPTLSDDETLNDVLDRLGINRITLLNGRKALWHNGKQVFAGRAGEVWDWLRDGCPVEVTE